MTFLGWWKNVSLSSVVGDLQVGDKRVTLNDVVYVSSVDFPQLARWQCCVESCRTAAVCCSEESVVHLKDRTPGAWRIWELKAVWSRRRSPVEGVSSVGPYLPIYKWGLRGPINGLINKWPPGLISRLLIKATTPFISGDGAHLVLIKDQSKYKVGIQTFHGNPWI